MVLPQVASRTNISPVNSHVSSGNEVYISRYFNFASFRRARIADLFLESVR